MSETEFTTRLESARKDVEACLDRLLGPEPLDGETARPETLMAAIRHGVLNGGKRFRPFLVIETTRLLGGPADAALRVAAALECIHCYSLIHDDLPAMDDDDLRRGRPTVHKAFDEAAAILAGDSLLTLAFDIIADDATGLEPAARLALVSALSRAAGIGGMAGGQALDLAAEKTPPDEAGIVTLQAMKTGALIRFGAEAGAIIAGAGAGERARLARFGAAIGLAFQLADDLLDLRADAETMGKATGKDAGRGKGTLVSLHGTDWAERRLSELVEEAEALLAPFGARAATLIAAARFVASRQN
ncbi:polyprenyl synthetase family protein [Martelella mediterranea]|uniref:polyprenyl synthetase family protein n=1 Tax=Martelella mediterranea TaxID=293089 RepID=UPI001E3FEDA6|nr:farnesyl diphosphate synthase [Martelella mediterranea]MCD1634099.1 polyprenyl synthetase family protein [Martelella mediterranea]